MSLGYLAAIVFTPTTKPTVFVSAALSWPVYIGVATLCVAMLLSASRGSIEPAVWGFGYIIGLAVFMVAGQFCGAPIFFGELYIGASLAIAMLMGLLWLDRKLNY